MKEKMEQRKKNNKGFSLVELIVVIAIMAILVGVVGMQIIPYINKSKEAKDYQAIAGFNTAAVNAYIAKTGELADANAVITFTLGNTSPATGDAKIVRDEAVKLAGYSTVADLCSKLSSPEGKNITDISVTIDPKTSKSVITKISGSTSGVFADITSPL